MQISATVRQRDGCSEERASEGSGCRFDDNGRGRFSVGNPMIANLQPYPEYKESGLPWLGPIPKHWKLLRSKYLFREVDERSITGRETRLSMSQRHGLSPSAR